ncbi:hypothetical protein Tco_1492032 [Tanacetum coccineum]
MEILPVLALNNTEVGNDIGVHLSSNVVKDTCSYFKLKDIFKASIKELKKAMNIQDTLSHALISKIFLKEHRVNDYKQIKCDDHMLKDKDIKIKIKIQDHKHAKETTKELPRIQGYKIQYVIRNEAISARTTS